MKKQKPIEPRDSDKRRSDVYDFYDQIDNITSMRKYEEYGTYAYLKMIQTGSFKLFDYGRGFLGVQIFVSGHEEGKYCARIWFTTVDDGDFGGWSKEMSKLNASTLVNRIAMDVFSQMKILPSQEELNLKLRPYGMYVDYE
jgi:hypothetical protein